ncbi:ribonuclease H family protein [Streptomyces yaizuensis]|uniref:Ribonuclease H n=1 Tax=Streptomyces yaizuensis TaxID=2989713 RepID=A0ABQ5P6D2_9ACTN|nr:ribonuclease H [Streptomyces sp. YSPA8]GLF98045.1 ribonuclease HI [Streptomyces sp. YSPA8]
MTRKIIAACDGASKGNPGPAAWAWVASAADGSVARWEAGPLGTATNNVAELTALLKLLEATDPAVPLEVRMDSQYAMKAATTWLAGWRRRGWKTAAGTPVANRDLVIQIDRLLTRRVVEFVHVRAHQIDGDPYNAVADQAASRAARTQRSAGTSLGSAPPTAQLPQTADEPRQNRPDHARTRRGSRNVRARFGGECRCGRPYRKGEPITKDPSGWGHVSCIENGSPTHATHKN